MRKKIAFVGLIVGVALVVAACSARPAERCLAKQASLSQRAGREMCASCWSRWPRWSRR